MPRRPSYGQGWQEALRAGAHWGFGSAVKSRKRNGDHLVKGVVTCSPKEDLHADEVRTVDFYSAKLLKQLANREQCERAMSSPDMEQGRWKGI